MNDAFALRGSCNACSSSDLIDVLNLGSHPLADTFISQEIFTSNNLFIPLVIQRCEKCDHCFTKYYIPPQLRYQENEYSYETGNSSVSKQHFEDFCLDVLDSCDLVPTSKILDIGGNDGTFLNAFSEREFTNVLNIEPSKNIADLAQKKYGIKSINMFFDKPLLNVIDEQSIDLIISTNVLNHYDDLSKFFQLSMKLIKENKYLVIEVPDLNELLRRGSFDTIYHEHVNYFSIKVLKELGERFGFNLIKWAETDYMCGSIRAFFVKGGRKSMVPDMEVNSQPERFNKLSKKMKNIKIKLLSDISCLRLKGERVIGLGAATKGNTLLNYVGLDTDMVEYICDHTQLKVGKFAPGSLIEIIHDADLPADAKNALILPSNLS